jgi:hypothetical protein
LKILDLESFEDDISTREIRAIWKKHCTNHLSLVR